MGFLAPALLAGALAVGLPLYLHLLRRQQEQITPFSTLMFLERTEETHIRQRRLRYLLLFALRALVVLLLAFAFAQPFFNQPAAAVQADRLLVLAMDSSLSMSREGLPEAAREAALAILNANQGKPAQVLGFSRGSVLLTEVTSKNDVLRDAVRAWSPGASAGSLAELAQAASSIHANEKKPLDLHVISDFQASAMPGDFEEARLPPGTNLVEHLIGRSADNWAVSSVIAPARVAPAGRMDVRVLLASHAAEDANLPLSLYFGDRKVASTTVDVAAGERAQAEFLNVEPGPRWTRGEIRLERADALEADNRYYFAVEKTDLQAVAFVSGASVNLSAKYIETALAAIPNTLFRFQQLAPSQLTEQNIRTFAFVMIEVAPGVLQTVPADLQRFVRSGGSLLLLLPRSATAGMPIPVAETSLRSASQGTERGDLRIDTMDPGHPALQGLEGLRGVRFLSAWNMEEDNLQVLARLGDNTPVLAEKRLGDGRILLLTSTLDSASNDIPFHPVFVPMVERISRYLSGLSARELSRRVDDFYEVRIPGAAALAAGYEVTGPEGGRVVGRAESLSTDGFSLESPGFYRLERAGGREDWVAANVSPRESDLTAMDETQLSIWKASGQESATALAGAASMDNERRVPFGWYGLLLLAGLLVAESMVANRYWRNSAEESI